MRTAGIFGASLLVALATACGGGSDNDKDKCGDGHVTGAEECDDGNTIGGDGCSSTCHTETAQGVCGDGVVDVATETCDDHNTTNGDGCDSTCHTETSNPVCGDGVVASTEQCDDHDTDNGDGCSSTCMVEQGYMCTGMPSVCTMTQTASGTCAAPINLTFSGTTTLTATATGDTTGSTDQVMDAPCDQFMAEGTGGHDQILKFTTTDRRNVKIVMTPGTDFDGLIRMTSMACMTGTEITDDAGGDGCSDAGLDTEPEELDYTALAAGTYYITVDGYDDSQMGTWSVTVTADPSTCGNGTVDTGETCDDGDNDDGDGCSHICATEPGYICTGMPSVCTAAPGSCGMPRTLTIADDQGNLVGFGSGDTSMTTNAILAGGCDADSAGGNGNDDVWMFTTTDTRDVVITLAKNTAFDGMIRLMSTCGDTSTEVLDEVGGDGCSDTQILGGIEMLRYPGLPAGTYYLAVDGYATTDIGTYSFTLTASAPGCGDGVIGTTEECDDGNTTAGDGCSATCTLESDVTDTEPNDTTPQALTPGNHVVRGTFSDTDSDLYTFTLAAPATVEIETYSTIDGTPINYSFADSLVGPAVGSNRAYDCGFANDTQLALFDSTGDVTDDTTALALDADDGAVYCSYLGPRDSDDDGNETGADPTQLMTLPAGTYTIKVEVDALSAGNVPDPTPYLMSLKITDAASAPVAPAAGDLKINEFLSADGPTLPVNDSNCDGSVTNTVDEFVELVNASAKTLDLTGVTISDSVMVRYTFAPDVTGNMLLPPGKSVVVWAGGNPQCTGVVNYFTTADQLGLNDAGDTISVKTADATPVTIATTTYGQSTTGVSFNLNPDVTGTAYDLHTNITGHVGNFSPGKKVDGSQF